MVAGQPIQTGAQTKEYDDGWDRIFKDRDPVRGRFVYTNGGEALAEPVQVGEDWQNQERRAQTPTEELVYGKLTPATDGTPIDSRRKHREYMQRNGLALQGDFKECGAKAQAERESYFTNTNQAEKKKRRETLGRVAYELSKKPRR
jgi:hypothetical protein